MTALRRWIPIVVGILVAGAAAVGYAGLAPRIADPNNDLRGTLPQPPAGQAYAAFLDDGRPVFIVHALNGGLSVLDAQSSHTRFGGGSTVAWCGATQHFEDLPSGSTFGADGSRSAGPAPTGLRQYALEALPERTDHIGVTSTTFVGDHRGLSAPRPGAPCAAPWLVHEPPSEEIFDPSVAVAEEPPGWVWLEGTLEGGPDGTLRLCDGLDAGCDTWAAVAGIGEEYLDTGTARRPGIYIGRVRDGAVEGLITVPNLQETT